MNDELKRLVFDDSVEIRHRDDVDRLREILNANGYDASPKDIQSAYDQYSDQSAAGWLDLPDPSEDNDNWLFSVIKSRLTESND